MSALSSAVPVSRLPFLAALHRLRVDGCLGSRFLRTGRGPRKEGQPRGARSDPAPAPRYNEALLEEGRTMRRLRHRRVVKLLGVIVEEGSYSLVMEHMEQGDLMRVLKAQVRLPRPPAPVPRSPV